MRAVFLDDRSRLRNGWWILAFIMLVALTRLVHSPVNALLKQSGVSEAWREPLPVVCLLFATWAVTRLRREGLSSVGLRIDARWAHEFAWGGVVGIVMVLGVTGLMAASGVLRLELDPARSLGMVMLGLNAFAWAALLEELLFRGVVFQRLIDGIGMWPAQLVLAALFAAGHWGNPGMDGMARIVGTLDIALAALMFGLAYVRTRSLALPFGLHLGWNWMQGSVLGFNVSGFEHQGWWAPVIEPGAPLLTGGGVGPEGSVFSIATSLVLIGMLWAWKGTAADDVASADRPRRGRGMQPGVGHADAGDRFGAAELTSARQPLADG